MTTESSSNTFDNEDCTMLVADMDDNDRLTSHGDDWLVNLYAHADQASFCEGTFDIDEEADENEAPDFDEMRPCLDFTLGGTVPTDMDVVGSIVTATVGGGGGSTAKIDFEVIATFVPDAKGQDKVVRMILEPRSGTGDSNATAFAALVGHSRMIGRPWFTEIAAMRIASGSSDEKDTFFDLPNASCSFQARFEASEGSS